MAEPTQTMMARVQLRINGKPLQVDLPIFQGPIAQEQILPAARAMAEAVTALAVQLQAEQGAPLSCHAGCGACCRQLVPIPGVEARRIRAIVDSMPEPRRSHVLARFAEARQRLAAAGLLDKLLNPDAHGEKALASVGSDYFALGIACPLLEAESCSIYDERPIACREYLVTSPPENCSRPLEMEVRGVPLPLRVSRALLGMDFDPSRRFVNWTPLALACAWADAHPDPPPPRNGPDLLREFLDRLSQCGPDQ